MAQYTYTISVDVLSGSVDTSLLTQEIINDPIVPASVEYCRIDDDTLIVDFGAVVLNVTEENALDALVLNHPTETEDQDDGTAGFTREVDPTATDDETENIQVGDTWVNQTTDQTFVCVDNTPGAAIWNPQVTASATLTDNAVLRGDGSTYGIQKSGVLVDDNSKMTIPGGAGQTYLQLGTDAQFNIEIGKTGGGTAFLRRTDGAGTFLLSNNSNNPQWIFGDEAMTGFTFIDSNNGTQMRLNTLGGAGLGGEVVIGTAGLLPSTDGNAPFGNDSFRWQRSHINHLVQGVDVFSGTDTLDDASFVVAQDGTYTLTLPTAEEGWAYFVQRQGSTGTVTLAADAGDSIDGAGSITIDSDSTYLVFAEDASTWRAIKVTGGGGGSAIEVEDEGTSLTTDVTKFNFVGAGVAVTEPVADEVEVNISGIPTSHASTHESGGSDPVNHDNLTGFVANEHIDHSAVSITGTNSVAGGGDLTASRTLELVNDEAAPGNDKYYGTDSGGSKGFFDLPAIIPDDLPSLSIRDTVGDTSIPLTWTDINFDTTDTESDDSVIEHDDVLRDRVLIKETGLYWLFYAFSCDDEIQVRIRINDTTVIPCSIQQAGDPGDVNDVIVTASKGFAISLTAGDFLTVQNQSSTTAEVRMMDGCFTVIRLKGTKGDKGDPGMGSTISVEDEGVVVPNGPQSIIDFVGAGVTAQDVGGGRVEVSIPGASPGTIYNVYKATGTQDIQAGPDIVDLTTERNPVAGFTLSGDRVTAGAAAAGKWKVTAMVSGVEDAGSRTSHEVFLTKDGTEYPGARGVTYQRSNGYGSSVTLVAEMDLVDGTVVDIRAVRAQGSGTFQIEPNFAALIFEKVSD